MGHLLYTKGTSKQKPKPQGEAEAEAQAQAQAEGSVSGSASGMGSHEEERDEWARRVAVVAPEIMNNHPPGGSFKNGGSGNAKRGDDGTSRSSDDWWCQHFNHPILQMSGQSDEIRRRVLRRVWEEGACKGELCGGAMARSER